MNSRQTVDLATAYAGNSEQRKPAVQMGSLDGKAYDNKQMHAGEDGPAEPTGKGYERRIHTLDMKR